MSIEKAIAAHRAAALSLAAVSAAHSIAEDAGEDEASAARLLDRLESSYQKAMDREIRAFGVVLASRPRSVTEAGALLRYIIAAWSRDAASLQCFKRGTLEALLQNIADVLPETASAASSNMTTSNEMAARS